LARPRSNVSVQKHPRSESKLRYAHKARSHDASLFHLAYQLRKYRRNRYAEQQRRKMATVHEGEKTRKERLSAVIASRSLHIPHVHAMRAPVPHMSLKVRRISVSSSGSKGAKEIGSLLSPQWRRARRREELGRVPERGRQESLRSHERLLLGGRGRRQARWQARAQWRSHKMATLRLCLKPLGHTKCTMPGRQSSPAASRWSA
jgi:hypothetical protein